MVVETRRLTAKGNDDEEEEDDIADRHRSASTKRFKRLQYSISCEGGKSVFLRKKTLW
jgi:hypothetical protein